MTKKTILDGTPIHVGLFFSCLRNLLKEKFLIVFGPVYILWFLLLLVRYFDADLLVKFWEIWIDQPLIALFYLLLYAFLWIVALWVSFIALKEHLYGKKITGQECIAILWKRLPHVIAVSLLCLLLIYLGFLLFIVPGFVVFVFLAFAPLIALASERSVFDAIKYSVSLVLFHNWFFVFLLVVLLVAISSFAGETLPSLLARPLMDAGGNPYNDFFAQFVLLLDWLFAASYYWIFIAGMTILYVSFDKQYQDASPIMRDSTKKIGCVWYGCFGFAFLSLALLGVFFFMLYGFYKMSVAHLLTHQSTQIDSVGNTITSEQQFAFDQKTEEIAQNRKLIRSGQSGQLVVDASYFDLWLRSLLSGTAFKSSVDLSGGVATTKIVIDVTDLGFDKQFIDAAISFSFSLDWDVANFAIYSGFVGRDRNYLKDVVDDFIGNNSFFWSDFADEVIRRMDARGATNYQKEEVKKLFERVKKISMSNDVVVIEFD